MKAPATLPDTIMRIINGARLLAYYTSWEAAAELLEVMLIFGYDPPHDYQELIDFTLEENKK